MGIPIDAKFPTSPLTTSATLPTPAQTPPTQHVSIPTPIADSYGDIFDLDKQTPDDAPPPYTDTELELALDNPPVQVTMWHSGIHILHGNLYYLPSLFYKLYERFMDISPYKCPRLGDVDCKPWVLFNEKEWHTWVDEALLHHFGVNTAQQPSQEPRFVAVTDNSQVLLRAESILPSRLGNINVNGSLTPNVALNVASAIIIALPSNQPLPGHRPAPLIFPGSYMTRPTDLPSSGKQAIHIKELTPAPTSTAVMAAVRKILSAADNKKNITNSLPKKGWMLKSLPEHLGESPSKLPPLTASTMRPSPSASPSPAPPIIPQQPSKSRNSTLSPSSPLWPHRGNEALFKRAIWQQLCYSSGQNDKNVQAKGGIKMPDAYSQVLFEDLQGRERVGGTEELVAVERKWYVRDAEVEGGWWETVMRKGKEEGTWYEYGEAGERMDVD